MFALRKWDRFAGLIWVLDPPHWFDGCMRACNFADHLFFWDSTLASAPLWSLSWTVVSPGIYTLSVTVCKFWCSAGKLKGLVSQFCLQSTALGFA